MALAWWGYGRGSPRRHAGVGRAELELIEADREEAGGAQPVEPVGIAWRIVLRDPNVLLLTASYFCMNYVFYVFFNWFFVYLVEVRGFDGLEGGFLATAPWLVGALGAALGGLWCDAATRSRGIRTGCRLPCLISLPAASLLLWAGAAARDAYLAVALLAVCFACTQLTEGAYWAAAISVGGRHSAAACGVMNTGGNAVGGVGALAESFGWLVALATGSLFALVGAALWLLIRADEPLAA
jgi:ACS family glucarate transporter-like MFS transporter